MSTELDNAVAEMSAYVTRRKYLRRIVLAEVRRLIDTLPNSSIELVGRSNIRKIKLYPADLSDERLLNILQILS